MADHLLVLKEELETELVGLAAREGISLKDLFIRALALYTMISNELFGSGKKLIIQDPKTGETKEVTL